MLLTRDALNAVDLEKLRPFIEGPNASDFFSPRDHYRLLALLSTFVKSELHIVDIGTCYGDSALALSYSGHAVETFDVEDRVGARVLPPTVHRDIADLFDPVVRQEHRLTLLDSGLILIDIAPHAGTAELELVTWLKVNDYRGIIILDDVWWYKEMRDNLWYRINPKHRTDLTSFGHWSGTGAVSFLQNIAVERAPYTSNWTLVTSYFDLTKTPDANDALRARSPDWYLEQHGSSVLSLDKNLVVFCDPEFEETIWKKRPTWLHHMTRVIPKPFESFSLVAERDRIISNRRGALECPSDPRATASYYLFCMSRYEMMRDTIKWDPFGSSHYGWIDLGIERMGYRNLIELDEALALDRNRFSTCFIDHVSKELTEDLSAYFGGNACVGRCSMSSGFFTGDAKHMLEFSNEIEQEFLRCLRAGYGHADEQLYPLVYYRRPDLFEWYCGDYTEIITNYGGVREHPEKPLRNLIRNSRAAGDTETARRACDILLDSYRSGKCHLDLAQLEACL